MTPGIPWYVPVYDVWEHYVEQEKLILCPYHQTSVKWIMSYHGLPKPDVERLMIMETTI